MKFASGGVIKGPSKDDSIPVVLSPGSYEISPEALKKYGPKLLEALNRMPYRLEEKKDDNQST